MNQYNEPHPWLTAPSVPQSDHDDVVVALLGFSVCACRSHIRHCHCLCCRFRCCAAEVCVFVFALQWLNSAIMRLIYFGDSSARHREPSGEGSPRFPRVLQGSTLGSCGCSLSFVRRKWRFSPSNWRHVSLWSVLRVFCGEEPAWPPPPRLESHSATKCRRSLRGSLVFHGRLWLNEESFCNGGSIL